MCHAQGPIGVQNHAFSPHYLACIWSPYMWLSGKPDKSISSRGIKRDMTCSFVSERIAGHKKPGQRKLSNRQTVRASRISGRHLDQVWIEPGSSTGPCWPIWHWNITFSHLFFYFKSAHTDPHKLPTSCSLGWVVPDAAACARLAAIPMQPPPLLAVVSKQSPLLLAAVSKQPAPLIAVVPTQPSPLFSTLSHREKGQENASSTLSAPMSNVQRVMREIGKRIMGVLEVVAHVPVEGLSGFPAVVELAASWASTSCPTSLSRGLDSGSGGENMCAVAFGGDLTRALFWRRARR
jgi:hypothetical protein